MRAFWSVLLSTTIACTTVPRPEPPKPRVAVRDFYLADDAFVRRFSDGPIDEVGPKVTDATVRFLESRRLTAQRVSIETETDADVIVSGVVTKIDGGNIGWRRFRVVFWIFFFPVALATMNTGAGMMAVEGDVLRPDGSVVGRFQAQGRGGGGSHDHAMNQAALRIGNQIAAMVQSGKYAGATGRTFTRATPTRRTVAPAPSARVADRLRELEMLRRDGLVTDVEYSERRREILGDL